MKQPHVSQTTRQHFRGLAAAVLYSLAAFGVHAQVKEPASGEPELGRNDVVQLSPFQVAAEADSGYFKRSTMAGTRTSERLTNIPQSIQIIGAEMMQDIALDNTVEILKYGASGVVKRSNILGDMFLRGFRVRTFLKDNISYAGNINVPLYDVDRIEVVKGPAALIFGQSSATGGLVNYVTKAPTAKRTASVKATIGSFDFKRVEANIAGPVGDTGLGYRGTFAMTDANGYGKFDYSEDLFLGGSVTYAISNASNVQLDYSYLHRDEIMSATGVGADGVLVSLPDDFTYYEPWVYGKNDYSFVSATLRSSITPQVQLQVVANYNRGANDWNRITPIGRPAAATGLLARNFQEVSLNDAAVNQLTDFLVTTERRNFENKLSLGWALSKSKVGPNNVTSVRIADLDIFNPVYNTPKPSYNRNAATYTRSLISSAYVQDQITIFDGKLIGVGGYRYNRFHTTTLSAATGASTERNDHMGVKRYGLIYKPTGWASLYYNYSESFVFNTGLIVGGPRDGMALLPSTGINKEVGLKVETSDGRFFANFAYFDLSLTNVRILVNLPPGSVDRFGNPIPGNNGIQQDGKETNDGAYEVDFGISLDNPLGKMQGIITLYHGDQRNTDGLLPNSVVNDTWSAFFTQSVDTGTLKGLRLGAGAFYRGSATGPGPAPGTPTAFVQPSYTTTTAFLSFDVRGHRVSLNVDNVLDKKRMIEGGEADFWLYTNPGRTVRLSYEYAF